ncbi:MAG: phosphoribosyl-ATP diphosphatase [Candidatus Hadarchaeales archaeon]
MGSEILDEVFEVIRGRMQHPREGSYVCRLISEGRTAEKVMEECKELIESAESGEKEHIVHEAADLFFHSMVLIAEKGVDLEEVMEELRRRRR